MRPILSALALVIGIAVTRQSQNSSPDDAVAAILRGHELDRQGHLKGGATELQSRLDDHIVVVSEGNFTVETREAMYRRFVEGFQNVKYSTWDDIERPVIKVSQDGAMAWAAFNVRSRYLEKGPDGKNRAVDSTICWLSIYEKRDGSWVMTAVATTYPSN